MKYADFIPNRALPSWYDEVVHNKVIEILTTRDKLHACKYLIDKSKENNPANIGLDQENWLSQQPWGLKWSKDNIVDVIAHSIKPPDDIALKQKNLINHIIMRLEGITPANSDLILPLAIQDAKRLRDLLASN